MPQIIAGIYELKDKIGAGGGGVVYLGEHTRLKKQVLETKPAFWGVLMDEGIPLY